ncbi:MAG: hypothetical protein M3N59_01020 [bacterium]|nr:hypothetical protein [bacterium]
MSEQAEFKDGTPLETAVEELEADIAQLERGKPMPEQPTDLRFGDTLPPCHPARNAFHEEAMRMRTALEATDPEAYQCATRILCLMVAFQSRYEHALAATKDPDLAASHAERECDDLQHPELISKIAARYYTDYRER